MVPRQTPLVQGRFTVPPESDESECAEMNKEELILKIMNDLVNGEYEMGPLSQVAIEAGLGTLYDKGYLRDNVCEHATKENPIDYAIRNLTFQIEEMEKKLTVLYKIREHIRKTKSP